MWNYFEFGPVVQEMSFKIFLIWSSGSPFVQWSGTICAILVESIMRNNSEKNILNLDQWCRRCLLRNFFHLELWRPFSSAEQNHLCNFGSGYQEEHFCEINLKWIRGSGDVI